MINRWNSTDSRTGKKSFVLSIIHGRLLSLIGFFSTAVALNIILWLTLHAV